MTQPPCAVVKTGEVDLLCEASRVKDRCFKLLNINIQCLSNKLDFIELLSSDTDADFLCISEHWLERAQVDNLDIQGYTKISAFCRTKRTDHGGTVVFTKTRLSHWCKHLQEYVDMSREYDFECSAILFNKKICILCLYRSQVGSFDSFIARLSHVLGDAVRRGYSQIIVCGDFNIDNLKPSPNLCSLNDLFDSYTLRKLIQEPTRIACNINGVQSKSGLDYVCTNIPSSNIVNCDNFQSGMSDHHAQLFNWVTNWDACGADRGAQTRDIHMRLINDANISQFKRLFKIR